MIGTADTGGVDAPARADVPAGAVLATRALTKHYGSVPAVSELTVDIGPGVTGLVGANGAGKSTLIRMLLGLLTPTSGSASVLGLDVATQGLAVRRRVGYMPERDPLPPDVTATEFVVHMGRMSGLPASAARERAADTLRQVGLFEARYRLIGGYSTGMRQRVRLAQALVHDPDLVLLDEPTNGLDPEGRDEMLALIRRIGTEFGISVLVTSHLLGELERISDHLVVIEAGRLTRSTSTADALSATSVLVVEVTAGTDQLAAALTARGWRVSRSVVRRSSASPAAGTLEIDLAPVDGGPVPDLDVVCDDVRDAVAGTGEGLVRMERRRHRLSEIFTGTPS